MEGSSLSHLDEGVEGGVGGVVCDEEPHVLVGDLDGGSRTVHSGHTEDPTLRRRSQDVDTDPGARTHPDRGAPSPPATLHCPDTAGRKPGRKPRRQVTPASLSEAEEQTPATTPHLRRNLQGPLKSLLSRVSWCAGNRVGVGQGEEVAVR